MVLKLQATQDLNFAADLLMQLLGGRGYMENNLAPQILRDARALSIGEGANESMVAAIGRSIRLGDSLPAFLRHYDASDILPNRLAEMAIHFGGPKAAGALSGAAATSWRDAGMGGLFCAAVNLATARALARRTSGHAQTLEWAHSRFEGQCRAIEQGPDGTLTILPSDLLEERIDGFRQTIGDIEQLAPDVEVALDPLLRRDSAAHDERSERLPGAAQTQPSPAENGHIQEKRELLRKLLQEKLSNEARKTSDES